MTDPDVSDQAGGAGEAFTTRARDYRRFRPGYPAQAMEAVLDGLGPRADLLVADAGAGTGIASRLLADLGPQVIAIEPNEAMRSAAEPHERVRWIPGTAEATGLDDACVDAVVCAQSYHWFEPIRACAEFARILRPGGRLALIWNDGDESTPIARGYYDLVRAAAPEGLTSHKRAARDPRIAEPFACARRLRFRNVHRIDADALVGRALSASYVPRSGPRADRLIAGLRALHAQHADAEGMVPLVYDVLVYLCEAR